MIEEMSSKERHEHNNVRFDQIRETQCERVYYL